MMLHRYDEELAMAEAREREVKSRASQRGGGGGGGKSSRLDHIAKKPAASWK